MKKAGFKTNKGGIKHRKVEPKVVDMYPIRDESRCPVRIILYYLSKFPPNRNCEAFYLQPKKISVQIVGIWIKQWGQIS